jgi:hypothetical protein
MMKLIRFESSNCLLAGQTTILYQNIDYIYLQSYNSKKIGLFVVSHICSVWFKQVFNCGTKVESQSFY